MTNNTYDHYRSLPVFAALSDAAVQQIAISSFDPRWFNEANALAILEAHDATFASSYFTIVDALAEDAGWSMDAVELAIELWGVSK